MKKSIFLFVLLLFSEQIFAQILDSVAVVQQVDSLIQVSRGLTNKRELDKALEVNGLAERLALERFGRVSASYGSVCHNRGRIDQAMSKFEESEAWYLEALAIRAKALGKNHADYGGTLNNLGYLYHSTSRYEKATEFYLEAKSIFEITIGKETPSYASVLNNLGLLYLDLGDYEISENFFKESRSIWEKSKGKNSLEYCSSSINIGSFYITMNNYDDAKSLLIQVVETIKNIAGTEHPYYTNAINNLAALYENTGNYGDAEKYYLESLALKEKKMGRKHRDVANSLFNLGNLSIRANNLNKAEEYHQEALSIRNEMFGPENYETSESLNHLAILYKMLGKFEQSNRLFLESLTMLNKTVGEKHLTYSRVQLDLSLLYLLTNRFDDAKKLLLESVATQKNEMLKSTRYLSERELAAYIAIFAKGLALNYSLTHFQSDISGTCYDNALFYKGFLLSASSRVSNLAGKDPATTDQFNRLKSYQRRLAAEYSKPIADRKGVTELEAKANDLEKELTRSVAGYGEAMRQVKWQEVQAALRPDEAAIEFVHYRFWNRTETDSVMYAALVLLPGAEQPVFVPLFEEKQLENLLLRGSQPYETYIKNLYAHQKNSLYSLLWQPLEKILADTKTIYYSPSGLLHRLNLAALPISSTTTLADRHTLRIVSSTRLLAESSSEIVNSTQSVLFGGIQYDMDSTAVDRANETLPAEVENSSMRRDLSFAHMDSTLRSGIWQYLPGTDREVSELEKILKEKGQKTNTFRAYSATEEAFRSMGTDAGTSPRILHLATHGFFFPDPKTERQRDNGDPVFKWSNNPLIRSGLIMAGGNHAWKTGKPLKPGKEDGILTAYEISQLNLSGTELVVLSACETGLGDIQGNEGVYGLQRAFKIAGVKYIVMSLWQVPDKQTSLLMSLFYKNWLGGRMTAPEALQAAQNDLRKRGFDPFYWAGFVLLE